MLGALAPSSYAGVAGTGGKLKTGDMLKSNGLNTVITNAKAAGALNRKKSFATNGLSSLAISAGTLSPVFSSATTSYSATVANSVSSITITAAAGVSNYNVEITGNSGNESFFQGSGSFSQALAAGGTNNGANTFAIVVFDGSPTGETQYTLTVTRLPGAPTVSATAAATNITFNSATLGYTESDDGGMSSLEQGVVYGTNTNPTLFGINNEAFFGFDVGTFSSNITGLSPNTTYYARGYAENDVGISYGPQITFSTPDNPPVITATATNLTYFSGSTAVNIAPGATITGGSNAIRYVFVSGGEPSGDFLAMPPAGGLTGTYIPGGGLTISGTGTAAQYQAALQSVTFQSNSTETGFRDFFVAVNDGIVTTTPVAIADINLAILPTLTTSAATAITQTSASLGYTLTNPGFTSVTEQGVVYSTINTTPTTADTKVQLFSSPATVNSLQAGTTYYVSAYAICNGVTIYGNTISFTTVTVGITTTAATAITQTTAVLGYTITNPANVRVTDQGVVYSTTNTTPTLADTRVELFANPSTVTLNSNNTTFYVRAYATVNGITVYGNAISFTTLANAAPTVSTTAAANITATSATLANNITATGGVFVTDYGAVYSSTNTSPTLTDTKLSFGTNAFNTGTYSGTATGLSPNTTYYVAAYATNGIGTSYGSAVSFTTGSANLSGIGLSAGTLSPVFSATTTGYTVAVANTVSSITITPTASYLNTVITVNGSALTAGSASVNLNTGSNTITISVTADGSLTNYYTITVNRAFIPPGNALAFDGVADGVIMGPSPVTVSGSFTAEAWVMPADGTKEMHVLSTRTGGEMSFDMQIMSGNKIHGDIGSGSVWLTTAADATFNYKTGQWIHLAYVVTPAGYSIYVNGNLVGSGTLSGTPLLMDNNHSTTIGCYPGESTNFNGSIDEVRMYNAALSQANIQADMLSTASSVPANLVNYYDFDNGAAGGTNTGINTLTDRTTTGYNGTLSNFALSGTTSNWVESYAMVVPTATAATGVGTTGFTANWAAPVTGIVTNYFVDVSTSSTFTPVISGSPFSATSTSIAITGLTGGNTYYYRVRADKASVTGEGDYSAVISTFIDDAPVIGGTVAAQAVNDNATISPFTGVTITDADVPAQTQTVSVTLDAAANGSFTTLNGFANAGGGIYTFSGIASAAQTAIRGLVFTPTANQVAPGNTITTTFTISVNDGIVAAVTDNTTTIVSTSIDDAPVLANFSIVSYTEAGAAKVVNPGITVSDVDNTNMASATVIVRNFVPGDVLTPTITGGLTQSYDPSSGILTLSGSDTKANYQQVLRLVTYSSTSQNPTVFNAIPSRTITFTVNDGMLNSNQFNSTVDITAVDNAPVLAGTGTASYTQAGAAAIVTAAITASDVDNNNLSSATVTILGGPLSGDLLAATTTGTAITATYNAGTGVLTLSGVDKVANYQQVLQSVAYSSTSQNPTNFGANPSRTISITANDGSLNSNTATATVNITTVDQAPVLGNFSIVSYTEAGTAVVINPGITVSDADNTNMASATVNVRNFMSGDVLAVTVTGNITQSYDPTSGILTLSGSDTKANYQQVLQSVTYSSTSQNPTVFNAIPSRSIIFEVNDGILNSNQFDNTVNITAVDNAPVLAGANTLAYTDGGAAVAINPGITVTDVDNDRLASATVTISNGFETGDVLAATTTGTAINATFSAGVLTLSGTETVANYQQVLQSVEYSNTLTTNTSKTVSFVSNDGSLNSNAVTSTINTSVSLPPTTVTAINPVSSGPTKATSLDYTVTFATALTTPPSTGDFTLTGTASGTINSITTTDNITYDVNVTGVSGSGTLELDMTSGSDASPAITNIPFTGNAYTIDNTPPTVMISAPSVASIGSGTSGTVSYTVTYADANFNTSSLTNSGVTLISGGTAAGTATVSGSGTSYTVTISGITGAGTLSISVGAGNASDQAGNTDAGAGPSATFNVLSNDAALTGLTASTGALSPVFNTATNSYTIAVPWVTTSIMLTPTAEDGNATIAVFGNPVSSGNPSPAIALSLGGTTIHVVVTAQDGTTQNTYTVIVNRAQSTNDNLARIQLNPGLSLTQTSATATTVNYTASARYGISSVTVTPFTGNAGATVTVDGHTVSSGTPSAGIPLAVGQTTITAIVTAQNGKAKKTYIITITRAPSDNANLATIKLNPPLSLTKTSETSTEVDYTASARYAFDTAMLTPATVDPGATVTVNGMPVTSGTASAPIPLAIGQTTITTVVTAQDLTTTKTYIITVTRALSDNANMGSILLNPQLVLTQTSATSTEVDYTASAKNSISSVTLTPIPWDSTATVTVQGKTVTPGTPSDNIPLPVGQTVITTVITAGDGTTQKTYVVTVTRAAPSSDNTAYQPVSVDKPTETPTLAEDGIQVHQGISPNADGINDFLQIDNISQYPDNKLSIMNRNGQLIYETQGYDNSSKIFDGHSNKNGQMQLPGTYFYQLDYTVSGITKHKTGFIILKY